MIRLSRTRRNDPAMKNKFKKPLSRFYASDMHDFNASSEDIVLVASVEDMADTLPSHDVWNIIIDTLPSNICGDYVCCQHSADCHSSAEPCQDMFSSYATPEGGILG